MTDIDRTLTAFFVDDSAHRVAPHLDEVLAATERTRQRPWWSSPGRWLPVDLTFERRLVPAARWRPVAVVLALLLLLAVVLGIAGTRRTSPGPFVGLAPNGLIAFIDGGHLKLADADGRNVRDFRAVPYDATSLAFSPDGTRLSYRLPGTTGTIHIVRPDGSGEVIIPAPLGEPQPGDVAWSFDASSIAYLKDVDGVTRLAVARADGSADHLVFSTFGADEQPAALGWSPDGTLLSFVSTHAAKARLFLVHPDGTGLQPVPVDWIDTSMGPITWAPDAQHQRLAFVVGDNTTTPSVVRVYDVATQKHTWIGEGFWPTWSPDGAAVACECGPGGIVSISFESALAGAPEVRRLQPDATEADAQYCGDGPSISGRAICSPAHWSPDGRWAAGMDVLGHDLVLVSTDGLLAHIAIHLDDQTDPGLPIAWQPLRS